MYLEATPVYIYCNLFTLKWHLTVKKLSIWLLIIVPYEVLYVVSWNKLTPQTKSKIYPASEVWCQTALRSTLLIAKWYTKQCFNKCQEGRIMRFVKAFQFQNGPWTWPKSRISPDVCPGQSLSLRAVNNCAAALYMLSGCNIQMILEPNGF